eukprot:3357523-Alexandrium_andersonii.AAC.1
MASQGPGDGQSGESTATPKPASHVSDSDWRARRLPEALSAEQAESLNTAVAQNVGAEFTKQVDGVPGEVPVASAKDAADI